MRIQSHYDPTLYLQVHLRQVWIAAKFLFDQHSPLTRNHRKESELVLKTMVDCHDLGKASPAFQQYIANPAKYTGNQREKSHACLSAAISLLWIKEQEWSPLQALALTQGVAGHHSGFASLDNLEERLRNDDDLMQNQMDKIDYQQLSVETGLALTNLKGKYRDGRLWLFQRDKCKRLINSFPQQEQLKFRLWVDFLFSILLEADKAFLALKKVKEYLSPLRPELALNLIDNYLANKQELEINKTRNQARVMVKENLNTLINSTNQAKLFTITLPTGTGKTLIAADWAITMREKMKDENGGKPPQIIIVLPYLSIIDQTVKFYRELLKIEDKEKGEKVEDETETETETENKLESQIEDDDEAQSELLMASHSLSERAYNLEGEKKNQEFSDFFIDTWRSEVIITTFDQLLMAIFSPDTKHLMRFHHLMDALIIFDEVQTLPCRLWHPVSNVLAALCQEGNSRLLMMSATQPGILLSAQELVGETLAVKEIFNKFSRYKLLLNYQQRKPLTDFLLELESRSSTWVNDNSRVLITLNTRNSARRVWQKLSELANDQLPVFLITADVTPKDRLEKIDEIKKGKPCFVVSTQCIEAGVDIDMDYVIRDFAPLDSIIQIAGRCNRNGLKERCTVEILHLLSDKGKPYDERIYDSVHLSVTHQVLTGLVEIAEEEIAEIVDKYFQQLKISKNLGEQLTKNFAEWGDEIEIRKELRGKNILQINFLVLHTDPPEQRNNLECAIGKAVKTSDRWERRKKLRKLSGQIQKRTVSIYANNIEPNLYATPIGRGVIPYFWLLNPEYYTSKAGLDLLEDEEEESSCFF